MITASQEAERDALRIRVAAEAERIASADRGHAVRASAEADADADKIRSLAMKIRHEVEAEGARLMNQAQNVLTPEARMSVMRMRLLETLEGIIRESVKPMEKIESIKVLQVNGLGGSGGGQGMSENAGGGLADNLVNSALRYRAQAPLVDQLLREIGIEGGEIAKVAQSLTSLPSAATSEQE